MLRKMRHDPILAVEVATVSLAYGGMAVLALIQPFIR